MKARANLESKIQAAVQAVIDPHASAAAVITIVVVVSVRSFVAMITVVVAGLPAIVGISHLGGVVTMSMAMAVMTVPATVVVAVVIMIARFVADIFSMPVAMIPMVGQHLVSAKPGS